MEKITTLVLPMAGRGMRLRPLTNDRPKALVPLFGKPLLEYFLEEAVLSGIKDVVLIISPEYREQLSEYTKAVVERFSGLGLHIYDQVEPWGHGRAVLTAYDFLKGKSFIIRFSDDVIFGGEPATASLSRLFDEHGQPLILLEPVPHEKASSYGVVGIAESLDSDLHRISHLVEKPKDPPSNLTVVGGYVITPDLLEHLKQADVTAPQVADGLLINEAFYRELGRGGSILGWQFTGRRFDCGNLEGFYEAEAFLKNNQD